VRSVLIARSHATEACEPRQVRKEAALSNVTRVPWASLAGACVMGTVRAFRFEGRVHGRLRNRSRSPARAARAD